MKKLKICPICGRVNNRENANGYCRKHQAQLDKYGKVLDSNPRTKFDPNEFRIKGDVCEMDTYLLSGEVDRTYTFDAEDYPIVSQYKWRTNNHGYASSGKDSILLHRLILGVPNGAAVDHINIDVTDNRKCNLRICQNSINSANRRPYNKWNIKGVEQHKNGKWSAYIRRDNKQYHSPLFDTQEEAAFARYILEQIIYPDNVLTQHNSMNLTSAQKDNVITKINHKLNA